MFTVFEGKQPQTATHKGILIMRLVPLVFYPCLSLSPSLQCDARYIWVCQEQDRKQTTASSGEDIRALSALRAKSIKRRNFSVLINRQEYRRNLLVGVGEEGSTGSKRSDKKKTRSLLLFICYHPRVQNTNKNKNHRGPLTTTGNTSYQVLTELLSLSQTLLLLLFLFVFYCCCFVIK